jgi:hypothetical protein
MLRERFRRTERPQRGCARAFRDRGHGSRGHVPGRMPAQPVGPRRLVGVVNQFFVVICQRSVSAGVAPLVQCESQRRRDCALQPWATGGMRADAAEQLGRSGFFGCAWSPSDPMLVRSSSSPTLNGEQHSED